MDADATIPDRGGAWRFDIHHQAIKPLVQWDYCTDSSMGYGFANGMAR
jgi:hypothetical protein